VTLLAPIFTEVPRRGLLGGLIPRSCIAPSHA
jgi:hypothetical protein